ncbi:ABC transporter permease subunit [Rhizobium sp. TRM95796]|uniref:ABC transporter permease subunit n=1 Tax=Rhizobium sp. TRM95796 TaxID=2979862 RepID=UPI0039968EB3
MTTIDFDISVSAKEAPTSRAPRTVRMVGFGLYGKPTLAISLITAFAILLAWWAATEWKLASPLFLPRPGEVLHQFRQVFTEGYAGASIWAHIGASLFRIGLAAGLAIVTAIPLGLLMGLNRWAKGILDTPIEFYWPLPPLAYLPLMIIWLGIGETSKVALLFLAMFAPICLAAQAGVRSVSVERANAARALGANRWQLFTDIVFPSALPEILTGVRIGLGIGWGTLVAAELIASTRGIGYMIMSAAQFLATDVVFVGIAIISVCAFAFGVAVRLLEKLLTPWKGKS